MRAFLLVVHLFIALMLIGAVLLQRSEGGGLGIGGGGGDFMGARGAGNILTRATAFLAVLFMASSLFLTLNVEDRRQAPSILDIEDVGRGVPLAPPLASPAAPPVTPPIAPPLAAPPVAPSAPLDRSPGGARPASPPLE